jgi:hypothetical protein
MPVQFRLPTDDPWFATTWEGARLTRLIEAANWTMAQKLAWLEETAELAARLSGRQTAASTQPTEAHKQR